MRTPRCGITLLMALTGVLTPLAAEQDVISDLGQRILKAPASSAREGLMRELALRSIMAKRTPRGMDVLARLFGKTLRSGEDTMSGAEMSALLRAADAFLLMAYAHQFAAELAFEEDVTRWLFDTDGRLRLFLDMVTPRDNWEALYQIVRELHGHDPEGCNDYRRLVLALAFVWDQPRPPLHRQMGGEQLEYDETMSARYDYFKSLFVSKRAEIPYRRLSMAALTYIVDIPLPASELRWIRKNVRPSNWRRKFFDIEYDHGRIERGVYQWPHGPYTLAAMAEKGGICVDQAYYATMCARAYGVPALMFVGEGRRGPHAWYGYMKGTEKWEMDIGRYTYDKYATGFATDPRTNLPMTDHDVNFMCARALRYDVYTKAARYGRLAFVLKQLKFPAAARQAARRSINASPLYELPWTLLEGLLTDVEDWSGLARLLETQAGVFRRYSDYTARIRARQAKALRRAGDAEGAERVLKRGVRRIDSGRDDLQRSLVSEQIRAAYDAGDYRGARDHLEDLLSDQKDEGRKIIRLLRAYLDLTVETQQTKEAARFLKRYIPSLAQHYGSTGHNQVLLLEFLLTAYENNGDEHEAKRLRRKIEKLRK